MSRKFSVDGMQSLAKLAEDDEPRVGSKPMSRSGSISGLAGPGSRRGSKTNATGAAASLILSAGGRRNSGTKELPLAVEEPEPEQKPVRIFSKEGPPADPRVMKFALKYNLKHYEVKPIIAEYDKACSTAGGGYLQEKQLEQLLIKVFQVKDVKPQIVKHALDAVYTKGEVELDKFVAWYVSHMFTGVSASKEAESDAAIRKLAKENDISSVEVDKIKRWFDKFDEDRSGVIDYDEFTDMMRHILNVKSKDELSNERLQKFWKEIDLDGNQTIDFTEYLTWYLKYFHSEDGSGEVLTSDAILAAYYDNMNPTLARGKAANKTGA